MISGTPIHKSGGKFAEYLLMGMYDLAVWEGRCAEELKISGMEMTIQNCESLSWGYDPATEERLKPRHKQTVNLYDLTIGAPKSVSLLALEDERVRQAFLSAARNSVREAEQATPSRRMIYSAVTHYTSRLSDPHLHVHAAVINLTYIPEKDRWECLRPNFLYWPRHQMTEHHRDELVQNLMPLGYVIEDKPKQGFEIAGVSPDLLGRFSRRSHEIAEARIKSEEEDKFLSLRDAATRTRKDKEEEPVTYREYLEWQREKLTQSERQHLRQTVERAHERRHKLGIHIGDDACDEGPRIKPWSYGQRVSM